jgi:histidinol-phosphate/aromatic aminotransferase/cobyric acid decarboxylase-like protein
VVGSLTKLLACPGLRLGYVLADEDLVERCRARQPAWALGGIAAAALPDLLETIDLPGWCAGVAQLRSALSDLLASHGLPVRPSDANWVLVDRSGLREALAPHGVVVRDCASFGLPGVTRIAVPSEDGLGRLDAALHAALGTALDPADPQWVDAATPTERVS